METSLAYLRVGVSSAFVGAAAAARTSALTLLVGDRSAFRIVRAARLRADPPDLAGPHQSTLQLVGAPPPDPRQGGFASWDPSSYSPHISLSRK